MFRFDDGCQCHFDAVRQRVLSHKAGRAGPTVGLALGSGAARGLAHIGVLKVLERESIPIDLIAGCSIGAVIGGAAACGMSAAETEEVASRIGKLKMLAFSDVTLPTKGLLSGGRIRRLLDNLFAGCRIEETQIPFLACATDVLTGDEMVICDGLVCEGVRASMSVPGIFVPHRISGRYLVDGGLVNPVPVDYLRRAGIDLCISVNVIPRVRRKYITEPSTVDIMFNAFDIMEQRVLLSRGEEADVDIYPDVDQISGIEFWKAPELIRAGSEAAEAKVAEILSALGAAQVP